MVDRAEAAGEQLAERHRAEAEPEPASSLVNFAESPRAGDWTLRSALVRFAQPQPVRAGAMLELVRRIEAALHPLTRALEGWTVPCDRRLSPSSVAETDAGWRLDDPVAPYPDTRTADLARLTSGDDGEQVERAYRRYVDLSPEEDVALPLLRTVLLLDELADVLVDWTDQAPVDPPVVEVDATCAAVYEQLEALGVPHETMPPAARRGAERRP